MCKINRHSESQSDYQPRGSRWVRPAAGSRATMLLKFMNNVAEGNAVASVVRRKYDRYRLTEISRETRRCSGRQRWKFDREEESPLPRDGCATTRRRKKRRKKGKRRKPGNDKQRRAYTRRDASCGGGRGRWGWKQRESGLHVVTGTVANSRFTQCQRSFALFRGSRETSNVLKRFTSGTAQTATALKQSAALQLQSLRCRICGYEGCYARRSWEEEGVVRVGADTADLRALRDPWLTSAIIHPPSSNLYFSRPMEFSLPSASRTTIVATRGVFYDATR